LPRNFYLGGIVKLISVSVGLPRQVSWKGKPIMTGIFKQPIAHRVMVRSLNLDGDGQADLEVHGNVDKAVYAYSAEHYADWRRELPDTELPWGAFGENLTIAGLSEAQVNIGDRFRVGNAELQVTQPRFPCFKLNLKFGRSDMAKRLIKGYRTGIYFSVVQEGEIGAGDSVERVSRDEHQVTVAEIVQLCLWKTQDLDLLRRAVQVPALATSLREDLQQQLERRT
jgi:MOSC domain-containing protein YiiM